MYKLENKLKFKNLNIQIIQIIVLETKITYNFQKF